MVLVVPRVAGEALMDELAGACIELEHAVYGRCASHCFARMDEEDEGLRAIATKNGVIMQPPICCFAKDLYLVL